MIVGHSSQVPADLTQNKGICPGGAVAPLRPLESTSLQDHWQCVAANLPGVGRVFKTSKAERAVQSLADTFRSVFRTIRAPDDLGSRLANPALVFRPRRGYACHAGISDKLPHVLVAVNDQAEIDGIGCGDSLEKVNPSLQLFGAFLGPRVARSI